MTAISAVVDVVLVVLVVVVLLVAVVVMILAAGLRFAVHVHKLHVGRQHSAAGRLLLGRDQLVDQDVAFQVDWLWMRTRSVVLGWMRYLVRCRVITLVRCRVITLVRYRVITLIRYRVITLDRYRVMALVRCRVKALIRRQIRSVVLLLLQVAGRLLMRPVQWSVRFKVAGRGSLELFVQRDGFGRCLRGKQKIPVVIIGGFRRYYCNIDRYVTCSCMNNTHVLYINNYITDII